MSRYVEIEKLIDGVIASLRDDVLPDVSTARARGRVWAILDILNNLRDRIEPKCDAAQAECDSVHDAVLAAADALRAGSGEADAQRLIRLLEAAEHSSGDVHARAAALRAVAVEAVGIAHAAPAPELARAALAPLELHIATQAMRDLMGLKVSLLSEISKG